VSGKRVGGMMCQTVVIAVKRRWGIKIMLTWYCKRYLTHLGLQLSSISGLGQTGSSSDMITAPGFAQASLMF
jgi:hypothetical protein